jgi:hypothetical protein
MQQQQQQREEDEDCSTTIRISRKTLNELGKHAKFRDNWDTAIQRVLEKAEDKDDNDSKLQPSEIDGGSF